MKNLPTLKQMVSLLVKFLAAILIVLGFILIFAFALIKIIQSGPAVNTFIQGIF